jgi:hypothetical protein
MKHLHPLAKSVKNQLRNQLKGQMCAAYTLVALTGLHYLQESSSNLLSPVLTMLLCGLHHSGALASSLHMVVPLSLVYGSW